MEMDAEMDFCRWRNLQFEVHFQQELEHLLGCSERQRFATRSHIPQFSEFDHGFFRHSWRRGLAA